MLVVPISSLKQWTLARLTLHNTDEGQTTCHLDSKFTHILGASYRVTTGTPAKNCITARQKKRAPRAQNIRATHG
jgi:hypothetical protein